MRYCLIAVYGTQTTVYILCAVLAAATLICVGAVMRIFRNNKRLSKSQVIVEFDTNRFSNIVFGTLFVAGCVGCCLLRTDFFIRLLLCVLSLQAAILFILILVSRSALTDDGIYVSGRFYDWFNVHDYYIDKASSTIVFSSHIKGGLTLKGLTSPLKYSRGDEAALEQFLSRQSGKFFRRITIR